MGRKQLAALAVPTFAGLLCAAAPSAAFDNLSQPPQGVTFYFSVPLDARAPKEQSFSAGFALQGKRQHETVYVDSRMINNFLGTGIEAKWVIAGVVAAGAVVAVASKDKSTAASYQEQQQAQQRQIQQQQAQGTGGEAPCPVTPNCP